jgi:phosphatidylserine decarboxylase
MARRISAWVRPGDQLSPGQRLGIIHFGSRAAVAFPAGQWEPLVRAGSRVSAGQTPIARRVPA